MPFTQGWAHFHVKHDSRGHKLEAYEMLDHLSRPEEPSREVHGVQVRAVPEVAAVIPQAFTGNYGTLDRKASKDFTHAWWFDDGSEDVERLCKLLQIVLTLSKCPELDAAIAGDFYKDPDDEIPPDRWSNTKFGNLVHRAKYWSGVEQADSRKKLGRWLAKIVALHPNLWSLDRIIIAPSTETGLSERLGKAVAGQLEVPAVTAIRNRHHTQPAKAGRTSAQLEAYTIREDLSGEHVVIVDDVWRSGVTMRSIAQAARGAGADSVCGVVGARTMRSR